MIDLSWFEGDFTHNQLSENAFNARLAYELNCEAKYDYPSRPSRCPIKGERMIDYAERFETTLEEMKRVLPAVEIYMGVK